MSHARASRLRRFALAAAFCALSIAAGCGRQTFDLLPEEGLAAGRAGLGPTAGAGPSGAGGGGSAGLGGFRAGAGGGGGRLVTPYGGSPTTDPCPGEGGCPEEEPSCPTTCAVDERCNPYTQRCEQLCKSNLDCADDKARPRCLVDFGVCVACIREADCVNNGPFNHCFLNTCVQCSESWQCASQQVCVGGRCIKH